MESVEAKVAQILLRVVRLLDERSEVIQTSSERDACILDEVSECIEKVAYEMMEMADAKSI